MSRPYMSTMRAGPNNIFYTTPSDPKQYDPVKPPLRPARPLVDWPENEKVYRSRMSLANCGSKYDLRTQYSGHHVVSRAAAPSSSFNWLRTESDEDAEKQARFERDCARLKYLHEAADDAHEHQTDEAIDAPNWLRWVKDQVLQPTEDTIKTATSQALKERLDAANKAYNQEEQVMEDELEALRTDQTDMGVQRRISSIIDALMAKMPGRFEYVIDRDADDHDAIPQAQINFLARVSKNLAMLGGIGGLGGFLLFASLLQTAQADTMLASASNTTFATTAPNTAPSSVLDIFPVLMHIILFFPSFIMSPFLPFIDHVGTITLSAITTFASLLQLPSITLFVWIHTQPFLINIQLHLLYYFLAYLCLHLFFTPIMSLLVVLIYCVFKIVRETLKLIDQVFGYPGIALRIPLWFKWIRLQLFRILVALLTPASEGGTRICYCVCMVVWFFFEELVWKWVGAPALWYYITVCWNSPLMHWVSLKAGSGRVWVCLALGIAVVNWVWVKWLDGLDGLEVV